MESATGLFSEYFGVSPDLIEQYGAFNISLRADLPLFIDPFQLFNSPKGEYQALHKELLRYLEFLKATAVAGKAKDLQHLYKFKEVKHTWLGFSRSGNRGSGLGDKFAVSLTKNLPKHFTEPAGKHKSKHLEKLCLFQGGVGRDNISDFTTRLMLDFLLRFTETFAVKHIAPSLRARFRVDKVAFSYETESWLSREYDLPKFRNDYVILVPQDLLTCDETWINRADMLQSLHRIAPSLPDRALREQVNNYFAKQLPSKPKSKDRKEAAARTFDQFPELVEYYIRMKEDEGNQALNASHVKVELAKSLYVQTFSEMARRIAETDFYSTPCADAEGALQRATKLKEFIEREGGRTFLVNDVGAPLSIEDELSIAFRFIWKREIDDPHSIFPADCKLCSNPKLSQFFTTAVQKLMHTDKGSWPLYVLFHKSEDDLSSARSKISTAGYPASRVVFIDYSSKKRQKPPRVFVSYSHDVDVWSQTSDPLFHKTRVKELADSLRREGIDCIIDQYVEDPPIGWPAWMDIQIREADHVIIVWTETYQRRYEFREEAGKGLGAQWEGLVVRSDIYHSILESGKFISVIFDPSDSKFIANPLNSRTRYCLPGDDRALRSRLWGKPLNSLPPLGSGNGRDS